MATYAIHITGQVQGVGFRPFVYRLASQLHLSGMVSNQQDGVHIKVSGAEETVQHFFRELKAQAPPLSRIKTSTLKLIANENYPGFGIVKNAAGATGRLMLTPDLGICPQCRQEMKSSHNRRFGYAFTTCTACGPRFSIMAKLPYDREHTSMAPFTMCEACEQEYQDPENRRYFSQTNSCPECPVTLALYNASKQLLSAEQNTVIADTVALLRQGSIVAVKGIGGFLLLADATNADTIAALRARKHRPTKPFALMYPDLESARDDVVLQDAEQLLLSGPEAPVVLAFKRLHPASGIAAALIAPHLQKLGVMLPYAPLFELLLSQFRKPLVATSANSRGSSIIFRNEDAVERLAGIADYVLVHNREILMPQDDSVLQVTPRHHQKIILRRGRGFAPSFEAAPMRTSSQPLALGADIKSTFSLSVSGNTYVSQYHGDLSSFDNLLQFEQNREQLTKLLQFQPDLILTDKHPTYASVRLGKQLAQKLAVPIMHVQHHEAHFAAVLAENKLLESMEPVLGVIWDGSGLGNDGLIRGSEFLQLRHRSISLEAQLAPFAHLLGDKMAREPRIAALALCQGMAGADRILQEKFTQTEWTLYQRMLHTDRSLLQTTSMGRAFDAAAALIGLCERMSYEGEAAMLLESVASREARIYDLQGYELDVSVSGNIAVKGIFQQLIRDVQQGLSQVRMAAKFHVTLVELIRKEATRLGIYKIAFSGGVFQNSLLVDLLLHKLSPDFDLFFHRQLPPNDECISLGQLSWLLLHEKQREQATARHPAQQQAENQTLKV